MGTSGFVATAAFGMGAQPPKDGNDPRWRQGKPPISETLEAQRDASAKNVSRPHVEALAVGGEVRWIEGGTSRPTVKPGEIVEIHGSGFGAGPDVDYAKILIGNVRVLERDLTMFEGTVDLLKAHFHENHEVQDSWAKEIISWNDTRIEFRVPETAISGRLVVHVQKRIGRNASLVDPTQAHSVWDALTERITGEAYPHLSDTVSRLDAAYTSQPIDLTVDNPLAEGYVRLGEAIFWHYDYNIGMVHHMRGLDWYKIMKGEAIDPVTGQKADPKKLFGAIPLSAGRAPAVASQDLYYKPYPIKSPLHSLFNIRQPLKEGWTYPTGYAGYSWGQGINPITEAKEKHIGFSCASCHASLVNYQGEDGTAQADIVPGIPNPNWSMKWATLGNFGGVKGDETGPDGKKTKTDKTLLLYHMPNGTGEHSLVRSTEDTFSPYHNDNLFSPIAIPIITRHLPVRRALSRTEIIAGFEGSYIHSEEPDGALGAMKTRELRSLAAYLGTLDRNDAKLERLGLYRTIASKSRLNLIGYASEGEFLRRGKEDFPLLMSKIAHGAQSYERSCLKCHASNFGTATDENMYTLSEVGTYFSPTIYNRETQSMRTAILRNLYWVAQRGLLHDGHVKSLEDLIHPDRVREGSELYRRLYTLNQANSFCIPKGTKEQERALRNQSYFVDANWTKDSLCWDYQKMRREFGPREVGSQGIVPIPVAPHPWVVETADEVDDLTLYLLTL